MRKIVRKITSFLVLATVTGSLALSACKSEDGQKNVEVWSTYNTVKVLQDRHDYDDIKMGAAVDLTMAQGEYEGAQLILTPESDISYYNVTVSDLTHTETGEIFDNDRIKVYKQEYVYLAAIYDAVDAIPGYYPDALIPLEAVVAYEENKIAAGDNQGIYLRFNTRPELDENGDPIVVDATATEDEKRYDYVSSGTYTGTVTLDFKTHTTSVPVTLNVVDATVSETAHAKTYFGTYSTGLAANLNYTQEGIEQWNDAMLEYRLSGSQALNDYTASDTSLNAYVNAIWKYISNPRCSAWTFDFSNINYEDNFESDPTVENSTKTFTKESFLEKFDMDGYYPQTFYDQSWAAEYRYQFVKTDGEGEEYAYDSTLEGVQAFDVRYFEHEIWAFMKKCIDEDMNVLHKMRPSFSIIDEPWQHNRHDKVRAVMTLYRAALVDLADKLMAEDAPSMTINGEKVTLDFSKATTFTKEEMLQTVLGIRFVVTADYLESFEGLIEYWCPTTDYYGSEYARENYYVQDEKWWYTAGTDAPTVSYTIEASSLYARTAGWMMADYDITGILYWSYSGYYERDGANGARRPIDEYFTANYMRWPSSNGNGYLMYPGAQYELDEMIPSMRLEAIRDGLEEYELMYNVKQMYDSISEQIGEDFDASKIIESLGSSLYTEDKIIDDSAAFASARASLLQLASCAESDANMCIVDYSDDTYGNQDFKIYVNEGVTAFNDGAALTDVDKQIAGVGTIYKLHIPLVNASNSMNLTFTCDGTTYEYTQLCGGQAEVFEVGAFGASDFTESSDISFSAQQVDCATEGIYASRGGNAIKLTVGASNEASVNDKLQYFKFSSSLFQTEFQTAKKIMIHVYNASATEIDLIVEYKKHSSTILGRLLSTPLAVGENCLTVTLPSGDWSTDYLEYFDFCVGEGEDATTEKVLYIKDVVIYRE
ncbi:MAG: DUF4091 domain-containing protein [Clostridia bacterium]|nr:DUF4091 domain-containing protein [Clostridia bacterium]